MFPLKPAAALQSPRDVTMCDVTMRDVTPTTANQCVTITGALEPRVIRYRRIRTIDYCRHRKPNHKDTRQHRTIINKSSSADEIPERDVTYHLIWLLIYHWTTRTTRWYVSSRSGISSPDELLFTCNHGINHFVRGASACTDIIPDCLCQMQHQTGGLIHVSNAWHNFAETSTWRQVLYISSTSTSTK